ncbi:MAG: DUF4190 domain-containing protein [Verrucomicrobiaceae bacterium]|nr:MAG: DUF4190 domain-containing protein [Verrucomicrobiaceae bacterium]
MRNGIQQGPFSPEAVRSFLNEGALSPSDLGRADDSSEWVALERLQLPDYRPLGPPRKSGLAITSLVLGIVGLPTVFPAIVAVVLGHLALAKIRRSAGALEGKGIAVSGLVIGYVGLVLMPFLIFAGFVAGHGAITNAKKVKAGLSATQIESAVDKFVTEYGVMPSMTPVTDTSKDASLAKTLVGHDRVQNTRGIKFLSMPASPSGKNGIEPATFRILDPWGRGYRVFLDTGSTGQVIVIRGAITEPLRGRQVAVYSLGPDGVAGTTDDVITW